METPKPCPDWEQVATRWEEAAKAAHTAWQVAMTSQEAVVEARREAECWRKAAEARGVMALRTEEAVKGGAAHA